MSMTDEQFRQAAQNWLLEKLYTDLASAKGRRLTPVEKLHLRGLLCGNSPSEIAEKLNKNTKGVETDLSTTLYRYVKTLVGKDDRKIDNWRRITEWLEEAGYKGLSNTNFSSNSFLEEKNTVNITDVTFENNQIKIGIYCQITLSMPSDLTIYNLSEILKDQIN